MTSTTAASAENRPSPPGAERSGAPGSGGSPPPRAGRARRKLDLRGIGRKLYGINERIVVPGLRHSQVIYAEMLAPLVTPETVWLDVGCGHRILRGYQLPLETELVERCRHVVGIDLDLDALRRHRSIRDRAYGDLSRLPFADASFDLVTANMVVEHLEQPEAVLAEVRRVLKPGGVLLFHTPNTRGYKVMLARLVPERIKPKLVHLIEGRREDDVFPAVYRMNSPDRITSLAAAAGLAVERIRMLTSSGHHALALLPPVSLLQLLWIRLLLTRPLRPLRTNIIAILRKDRDRS